VRKDSQVESRLSLRDLVAVHFTGISGAWEILTEYRRRTAGFSGHFEQFKSGKSDTETMSEVNCWFNKIRFSDKQELEEEEGS
jgi:hypothetical protein